MTRSFRGHGLAMRGNFQRIHKFFQNSALNIFGIWGTISSSSVPIAERKGRKIPMCDERDVVVFTDDEGKEFELEVVDYFEYEDQEYAVLMDTEECDCEDECCEHETEVYIMKIVVNGEMEEFLPADEDKMEELIKVVEARFEEWECDCEDEDCDHDDDCDCGCCHD